MSQGKLPSNRDNLFMSNSQKIRELRLLVDDKKALKLLDELEPIIFQNDPDLIANEIGLALKEKWPIDDIREIADRLELALAKAFTPRIEQRQAFKTDMRNFFRTLRNYFDIDHYAAALDIMTFYPHMFNPAGKTLCGSVRSRCRFAGKVKELMPDKCTHLFVAGEIICPNCGDNRTLCRAKPRVNGRCVPHGGAIGSGVLHPNSSGEVGRAKLYAMGMNGKMVERYVPIVSDSNFMSVAPELGVLAARYAELIEEIGDVDLTAASVVIKQALSKMEKAADEERYSAVLLEGKKISEALEGAKTNSKRWNEISDLSLKIARLADAERKRVKDAQTMISPQEMYQLQEGTLGQINNSIDIAADRVFQKLLGNIIGGRWEFVNPKAVGAIIRKAFTGVMAGNIQKGNHIQTQPDIADRLRALVEQEIQETQVIDVD